MEKRTRQDYLALLVQRTLDGTMPGYDPVTNLCEYLTKDGHQCGVGVLIPKEKYLKGIEGVPAIALPDEFPELFFDVCPEGMSRYGLDHVQRMHDNAAHLAGKNKNLFKDHFFQRLRDSPVFRGCDLPAAGL